jgi:hypothetical protein
MRYRGLISRVGLVVSLLLMPLVSHVVQAMPVSEIDFTELNITGDEYVVIQNLNDQALDMSDYWLGYTGSDTATAVPSQQLPQVTLQPRESLMLSNGAAETCGAVAVDDLGPSLSNTAGTLALWRLDNDGMANFAFLNAVSWGKSATGPNYLKIADEANVMKYNAAAGTPTWLKTETSWQVGDKQGCAFTPVVSATEAQPEQTIQWVVSDETPPFTVLPVVHVLTGSSSGGASIPAVDIGLKAVILSEMLADPASPQSDAENEFIELYNPNDRAFDLTGFKLQFASTTSATIHSYTIPSGTMIPAKGFKTFTSGDTSLSLNNTAGQVWFVDPLDHTISTTGLYSGGKEGASFINAGGKWQWTTSPTPGAANKLQPLASTTSDSKKKSASVNGRSITGVVNTSASGVAGASAAGSFDQVAQPVPLHPGTLAAVIGLAVLYLAYEYRHDLANRLNQLREYRRARS